MSESEKCVCGHSREAHMSECGPRDCLLKICECRQFEPAPSPEAAEPRKEEGPYNGKKGYNGEDGEEYEIITGPGFSKYQNDFLEVKHLNLAFAAGSASRDAEIKELKARWEKLKAWAKHEWDNHVNTDDGRIFYELMLGLEKEAEK